MASERIPTSQAARAARVGRLAASEAVRHAGTHAANLTRPRLARRAALERRHLETAEQILNVLGTMKGVAMKFGQMLSFVDLGMVPSDARPEFQRKLAALRDAAPQVPFARMLKVLEEDLGKPPRRVFADIDERPVGVASIGQVYRAVLTDGREVAIKVQYPGVAAAVRADIKNLTLLMRLIGRAVPSLDIEALAREIRLRIDEELDYELEAANQHMLAEAFRGHPFVLVPDALQALSHKRVLVSEYVEGTGFEELKSAPDQLRDRCGEIVFRFFCGTLYRRCEFSGDPHPGNFLLQEDGRVAFFDFGLFKRMDRTSVGLALACQRAAAEGRAEDLHRLMAEANILPEPERVDPERLLGYVLAAVGWYLIDEHLRLTPEIATETLIQSALPQSYYVNTFRHQRLPPEHVLARRLELFCQALLGQLRAGANWHRIAREWMYGEEPVTELGRLEADHYAGVAA
jgi:predicted unusual protein kinase regulating ubiquinone biosynthesis (AarF/ABC1/UbiB family)